MNRIDPIRLGSSFAILELGTTDVSTPGAPATISGGTCTGRLFDDTKDSTVTLAVSSGDVVEVHDASAFQVGDTIYVMLDSRAWHDGGAITVVNVVNNTLAFTNAIPSAVRLGRRVTVKIGPDVAMPAFGTPVLGTFDWGYRGIVDSDHTGLVVGMKLRVESDINISVSQRLVQSYRTYVAAGT